MNAAQIKAAVNKGHLVYWKAPNYVVTTQAGDYYIKCTNNNHLIGLTWLDGTTLNGNEEDFFLAQPVVKEGFVIISPTMMGSVIGCLTIDEQNNRCPYLFDTLDIAWKEIIGHHIRQLQDFLDNETEFEDVDLAVTDGPAYFRQYADGKIEVLDPEHLDTESMINQKTIEEWRQSL